MKEYRYEVNGRKYRVRIKELYGDTAVVQVNEDVYQVNITEAQVPDSKAVALAAPSAPIAPMPVAPVAPRPAAPAGAVTAPMPGVILKVLVQAGDMVNAGDVVMIIEAMKMENNIKANASGTVKRIMVNPGDSVNTGQILLEIS